MANFLNGQDLFFALGWSIFFVRDVFAEEMFLHRNRRACKSQVCRACTKKCHIFLVFSEPFQLRFVPFSFVVSLHDFPLLHMNCIKLLYNKHEFLRFLKQGSGRYFYQCYRVFFSKNWWGRSYHFAYVPCVSVSPSSGLKVNYRNNWISKPNKTNTFERVSSLVSLWLMWTVEIEYDFYQVCNEIQNRWQKSIFWSVLTID